MIPGTFQETDVPSRRNTLALVLAFLSLLPVGALAQGSSADPADQPQPAVEAKKKVNKSKAPKESKGKTTAEQKKRAMIESGAKTAIEWYGDALKLYQRGRYLDARGILLPLEDSARAVDIQEKVKLLIADTYFEQGGALNLAEALARYKSFLTFFPASEHADYAQYQLGRSYFKQLGNPDRDQSFTDQAIFEYQKLIDSYPDSEYVAQARKDVLEAKARRAQHEYEVAKFYWDWNDKTAAAERLKSVLKERPELPEREKALYMAAQSLYDTGQREEGDAYAARLAADYPGSQYVSRLNPSSQGAIAKQAQRDKKREKELARTHRSQAKQDRRRTRLVRKDSGLPGDVPQTWEPSGSAASASSSSKSSAAAAPSAAAQQKAAERDAKQKAESAKLEQEERSASAKEEARKQKREEARERELAQRDAKKSKEAAALASETPEQKAEREKKEARQKKEADRLEAEEARAKAKQLEHQKKLDAQKAKEAAKKAKKGKKK